MADEASRSRNPAGHAGLLDNLIALIGALAVFLESRAALFAKESRTAVVRVLVIAVCLLLALMVFAFGYVFLIAAAVMGIAKATNGSLPIIGLAAAGVHFLFAVVLVLVAQAKMKQPLFRATVEELKMDSEPGRNDSELKAKIARSREQISRDLRGLRYELDFPRKIRRSFQRQTVLWIGGAIALGALLSVLSRCKKEIHVDAKSGAKSQKKVLAVGAALGALRIASNLLKPVIINLVERKIRGYASSSRPGRPS